MKWFIIYNPEEQTTEGFNLINIVNNRLNAFKQIFTMLNCKYFKAQALTRTHQDVDVLVVLDFQIPCIRYESPALYLRGPITKALDEN